MSYQERHYYRIHTHEGEVSVHARHPHEALEMCGILPEQTVWVKEDGRVVDVQDDVQESAVIDAAMTAIGLGDYSLARAIVRGEEH